MHFVAYLHLLRGEVQAAHRQIDALLQLANEQGFSTLLILGHLYRSEALVRERKAEVAIAQTEKLLESLGNSGDRAMYPIPQVVLARAYGQIGQIEHGLANLSEAQRWVEARSQDLWQSELYRIKGTLLLAQADHQSGSSIDLLAAAEASFRQSLEVAHRQQAKLSELRAMISLCRLWQRQGKVEEARSALSELYGWFTEGFETADLVEAKRLLMELTTPGLTLG
jgi:predicted ATPase